MSELRLGGLLVDTIGQLKVGSSNVQKAYVGSVQVFPASSTTTTSTTSTTTTTLIPTTTTTSTTTSTTTPIPTTTTTTSTTTSTTTEAPTTTTSTTSTTTIPPTTTTTSTTTSTTTETPTTTTTSTTTSTTTEAPTTTTSTTTSTTTAAPTVYSYSIWTLSDSTSPYDGADSAANACTFLTPSSLGVEVIVYSTSATFQNGMTLFTDIALSTAFVSAAAPNNYFRYDINSFRYSSSVTELTACPATTTTTTSTTTSTTTEAPTTTTTSTTTTTTTSACTSYTVFDVPDAASSTFTYQDCSTLETVSVTISDGGDEVTFCAITGTISVVSGNITIVDNGPCIPTTTTSTTTTTTTAAPTSVTIFWNTSEVGSGGVRLVIYDSTSTPIVDEESSGAGPTNGSVTTSNTPFTVAVSRIAGTEVAQYRICNDSNSTEITHNYNVTSEVTYVVDPTPLTTTIFATYGDSNTPINCSVE